jgi:cyclase
MSTSHHEHTRATLPPPRTDEVADGVFAYVQPDGTWWINNCGFIAAGRQVVAIDTCSTERRTRAYLSEVERLTGRLPGLLVNTHHHGDHTNGNCLLPDATVIGHERCRTEVLATGILRPDGVFETVDWGDLEPAAPFVTFSDRLDLWVGDLRVELHHLTDAAHTTNDVVAWIPDRKVLYTGDLVFNGGTPFVLMGSVAGSLEALDRIVQFDADVLVPGHGGPIGREGVDVVGRYLRFVQLLAEEGSRSGLTPLELARSTDLGEFGELSDSERLVGNLHRAYAECSGARPGAPIDILAAFVDMMELNGGRPLRCMA